MRSSKAVISQAEVRRYLKAMREAGFDDGRLEIERPDGIKTSIVTGGASEDVATDDWDAIVEKVPYATS